MRALLTVVCVALMANAPAADPVTVTVTSEILRKAQDVPPLGLGELGDGSTTAHTASNLISQGGFEPIGIRHLFRVIGAGKDKGIYWVTLDGPGAGNWHLYTTGTLSGARMRAYRFAGSDNKPLPYKSVHWAQGGKMLDVTNADRVVKLFDSKVLPKGTNGFPDGGWTVPSPPYNEYSKLSNEEKKAVRSKWRVYYKADVPLRMDDIVIFDKHMFWPEKQDFHPRISAIVSDMNDHPDGCKPGVVRIVPHDDAHRLKKGGESCLRIESGKSGKADIWANTFGNITRKDATWYGQLEPGVRYRYEAWMRQSEMKPGNTVKLGFSGFGAEDFGYVGNNIEKSFKVEENWKLYGFEFVAPAMPTKGSVFGPSISFEGSGKLFVDNWRLMAVYAKGDAKKDFVVNRKLLKRLLDSQPKKGKKGALRIPYGLFCTDMKGFLGWYAGSKVNLGGQIRVGAVTSHTLPRALMHAEATGDSPANRMRPWLIIQVMFGEEDYRNLIEYLAAPYNPRTDSKKTKPYAHMRYAQRGHGRPWTRDFQEITIELGNENWHNRSMADWIGFARYHAIHQGGREYGLFSRHIINETKKSPYWTDAQSVVSFSLGGNYSAEVRGDGSVHGYGQDATQACGLNKYEGHATYVGPRWETGESSLATIDDKGFQKTLVAYKAFKEAEWTKQSKAWERLLALGYKVKIAAYEGGPTGFEFKASTKNSKKANAAEIYGKSLAMGVATFDGFLDAYRLGWTEQLYSAFKQGVWWSSHTAMARGERPSPGFLALVLRNRHMSGDLLRVELAGTPTQEFEIPLPSWQKGPGRKPNRITVPMLGAYAMRDGNQLSVAFVNRSLSESIPVLLRVPMADATRITSHALTGDPRATNLESLKIELRHSKIRRKQLRNGMMEIPSIPPGSVIVYKFRTE